MKTYKIVLTGGPCGGKTDSIDFLSKKLIEQDYSVKIVNETANSLLKLGYMPSVNISTFDFQNLLFKIQFLNEYMSEGKSNILLCDRGLFDGKVYQQRADKPHNDHLPGYFAEVGKQTSHRKTAFCLSLYPVCPLCRKQLLPLPEKRTPDCLSALCRQADTSAFNYNMFLR